ncbi:MAG TPA: GGDEF domain-containing protein [Candidatus Dormibacteraeota bacterium]|nr:GGDEF domain-containing protein [Candidatus Dormibacteraeota bacterium]
MGLAVIADLSAALPSGPRHIFPFVIGTILLGLVCAANTLPWRAYPQWTAILPSCLYVVSAALIIISVGTIQTGMMPIFLIPVLWTALYLRKWQSAVVVSVCIVAVVGLSLADHEQLMTMLRRAAFWAAISIVLTVATHGLRDRLHRALAEHEESLRQADGLSQAAQHLTSLLHPDAVLSEACLLAAVMVSPPSVSGRRATYFRIDGDTATGEWEFDDSDHRTSSTYPLAEHPYLTKVVRTREPACGPYDLDVVGPTLRANLLSTGTTHGAWIPIAPNGVLHGVLTVSARGMAISDELFARAVSLGQIVELALSNALALQKSRREAATDPLTGLANRRGLEVDVAQVRGRRPFAVLALDVDGLKSVNDSFGHATGDSLLVGIAQAATRVMRRGDVMARTGGDEFAAFLLDANEEGAARAAQRILDALKQTKIDGVVPAISIGAACGAPDSELMEVLKEADAAMYVAKGQGGHSYKLSEGALQVEAAGSLPRQTAGA